MVRSLGALFFVDGIPPSRARPRPLGCLLESPIQQGETTSPTRANHRVNKRLLLVGEVKQGDLTDPTRAF